MTLLETIPTTPGTRRSDDRYVLLATGLLMSCLVGTNAGLGSAHDMAASALSVTANHASLGVPQRINTAEEVAAARDELVRHGLTRQEIARGLGVDRRSLSGWASGDIRPTPARLAGLRALVDVVLAIDAAHPGRTREILTRQRAGTDLLAQLAHGRIDVLQNWEQWLQRPKRVTVTRRSVEAEPLWAAAAKAKAAGRLQRLERRGVVRADSAYDMDLQDATAFEEPSTSEPRRRSYK